jgi:iron complex outermembrane recepter protein
MLKGTVKETDNNLPISYVMVVIDEIGRNCSTDSLGRYQFEALCAGDYTLTFYRIGFKQTQKKIHIPISTPLNISLDFDPGVFSTVEIETERQATNATQISSTIDRETMESSRGLSLGKALSQITGLSELNTGSTISKPIIHGLHGNRILILNNGIRQEGQQWGSEHAPEIDPFIAEKLTVIKGANTLRYGHDAIGGVILVEPADHRTTPGISSDIHLIGASNGRMGAISGSFETCLPQIPALTVRAQGTLKRSGNVHSPNYYLKNTGTEEMNYSLSGNYRHRLFNLQIFYSQFNSDVGIFSASHIGNLTDLEKAIQAETPLETSGFSYQINRPFQRMEHELLKVRSIFFLSEKSKLTVTYARQYDLREEYDKHRPLNDSLAALDLPELNLEITTHSGDVALDQRIGSKTSLQVGANWMDQGNTVAGRFFIPNYVQQGIGGFVLGKWKKSNFEIEGAFRYDQRALQIFMFENDNIIKPKHEDNNWAASMALLYRLGKFWTLTINGGRSWRQAQANERYSNGLHHGSATVEIGDRNLKSEISNGVIGNIKFSDKKYLVEFSPYFNAINNFIFLSPQLPATLTIRGAFPTFVYRQTNAFLCGADFTTSVAFHKKFSATLNVALLRAIDSRTNEFLPQMPADKYQFQFTYTSKSTTRVAQPKFTLRAQYNNKQWRMPANSDYIGSPPAYILLHCSANAYVKTKIGAINLGLEINNLLNETYREYLNRFRYYTDEMGRNITMRITIPINHNFKSI